MSSLLQNLKSTATGRLLTHEDIHKPLEQLRDHLIHKNVAFEVANRLCDGVAESLVGVQLGPFERVTSRVRVALEESCSRLLASGRRVDVLRDALEAQQAGKPYVIVFCGVNGVGKSTNLAKVRYYKWIFAFMTLSRTVFKLNLFKNPIASWFFPKNSRIQRFTKIYSLILLADDFICLSFLK